jgi:hypothetical protein
MSQLSRARERLTARKKALAAAKAAVKKAQAAVASTARTVKRLTTTQEKPGPWMTGVVHDPVSSIGAWTVGKPAGLLHTTEGLDFPTMDRVLKSAGACPHFLVSRDGRIKQYRPWGNAATALENHPGGVETNRKRVVQIEVCAFAKDPDWPTAQRNGVAKIMAWANGHGVPLTSSLRFTDATGVRRLSGQAWIDYSGWCGHQHAPENSHWDPGAVDITDLLSRAKKLR